MFKIVIASCILTVVCINLQTVETAGVIPNPLDVLTNVQASTYQNINNVRDKIFKNIGEALKTSEQFPLNLDKQANTLKEETKALMVSAQQSADTSTCSTLRDYVSVLQNELLIALYACVSNEIGNLTGNMAKISDIPRETGETIFNLVKSRATNLNPMNMVSVVPDVLKTLRNADVFSMLEQVLAPMVMNVRTLFLDMGLCTMGRYYGALERNRLLDLILNSVPSCVESIAKQ